MNLFTEQTLQGQLCFYILKNFGNFIPIASSYENKLKTGCDILQNVTDHNLQNIPVKLWYT